MYFRIGNTPVLLYIPINIDAHQQHLLDVLIEAWRSCDGDQFKDVCVSVVDKTHLLHKLDDDPNPTKSILSHDDKFIHIFICRQ